uniref:Phospholipid transfer protein n=1 Tax=Scleropages formosus TaxID=113540 RepID=A0A8C9TX79_SCLFO
MLLTILFLAFATMMSAEPPGCKIRITSKGLDMLKYETQKFVEEELENITVPDLKGKEGGLQYTIQDVKIQELNLTYADLRFQPDVGLLFDIQNSSISLTFQRHILYWFLKVYEFLASFLTTGMRFILNQQICPTLNHAGLVLINSLLDTVPVRQTVDKYVGIDYALLSDPVVTSSSLDMDFRVSFFFLKIKRKYFYLEYDRMVYLALSEYFFDSGMYAYYKAGVFSMQIANERMPKDLEMLLRTTYFGTIMMLNPALMEAPISLELEVSTAPRCVIKTSGATVAVTAVVTVMMLPAGQTPVQLSSMTMEAKLNAKVSMKGKKLAVHMDLRRFKIYSNQSALESLALIPLQGPLKTMLQISIVPIINNRTKKGVQIPLPEGMDFIEEVVEYHNGFIIIGANLHFTKGLREVIESNRQYMPSNSTLAP